MCIADLLQKDGFAETRLCEGDWFAFHGQALAVSRCAYMERLGPDTPLCLQQNLPPLWAGANLEERWKLLLTMLDAVYVDAREDKRIVAIKPKPPFMPVFQVATTKEGSGIILINEPPEDTPEARSCFWWRRGRVELPLKRGFMVWVIDGWPAMVAVNDSRSRDSPLAGPIPAEEECLGLFAA